MVVPIVLDEWLYGTHAGSVGAVFVGDKLTGAGPVSEA